MKEMNVHIYNGKDRFSATKSIIPGNTQVISMTNYRVGINEGIFVVAFPNKNKKDTEFEFQY